MTAQAPERIIIDGRPRPLYAAPLYRLLASRRLDLSKPGCRTTGNYRGYTGTWEIRGNALFLIHINWEGWDGTSCAVVMPSNVRARLFRAVPCEGFPIKAHWFNGRLRIAIGRRMIYSHQGWSHWFERERVISVKGGIVVRDREVDTRAMVEWKLRVNPGFRAGLFPDDNDTPIPLLDWSFTADDEDWTADWWPPDYQRSGI